MRCRQIILITLELLPAQRQRSIEPGRSTLSVATMSALHPKVDIHQAYGMSAIPASLGMSTFPLRADIYEHMP